MRYLSGLRHPTVFALIVLGGAALIASFLISGTPEHVVHAGSTTIRSADTHPIDVMLFIFRAGGGLAFLIGVLALIAYGRGEMEPPAEAIAPGSHTTDDDLPATPPGNFIFRG